MWNHCASLRPCSCDHALQSCRGVVVGVLLARPSSGETCYDPSLGLCIATISKPVPCCRAHGSMGYVSNQNRREFRETKPLPVLFPVFPCPLHVDHCGFKNFGAFHPSDCRACCNHFHQWFFTFHNLPWMSQRLAAAPDSQSPLMVLKHGLACESSSMAANVLRLRTAEVFAGLASSYQEAALWTKHFWQNERLPSLKLTVRPENGPSQMEISSSNHPLSGANC